MFFDVLDILNPHQEFTAEGTYFSDRPDSLAAGGGQTFNFEYVNPYSKTYQRLFGNFQSFEAGEVTIRTNDEIPFKSGGYFITQDGELFKIIQVARDYQSAPKQALRIIDVPLGSQYVVRAVNVPNPWGAV